MAVPQSTAVFPPAFSAILPPMVEAQALVGSVAKTRFLAVRMGHGIGGYNSCLDLQNRYFDALSEMREVFVLDIG